MSSTAHNTLSQTAQQSAQVYNLRLPDNLELGRTHQASPAHAPGNLLNNIRQRSQIAGNKAQSQLIQLRPRDSQLPPHASWVTQEELDLIEKHQREQGHRLSRLRSQRAAAFSVALAAIAVSLASYDSSPAAEQQRIRAHIDNLAYLGKANAQLERDFPKLSPQLVAAIIDTPALPDPDERQPSAAQAEAAKPATSPTVKSSLPLNTRTHSTSPIERQNPGAATTSQESIQDSLSGWAKAWSAQDPKAYFSYYHDDFHTANRKRWQQQRQQRLLKPAAIQIRLSNIQIQSQSNNSAQVLLEQHYNNGHYADISQKQLSLRYAQGHWQIASEQQLKSQRIQATPISQ